MAAGVIDVDRVKYACTCGLLKTLQQLYLCRYCSELRCTFCVSHEVDSHFCGKCCENLPSAEARVKKNRCVNCFVCPSCRNELSTRAACKQPANPGEPATTKKTFYLLCLCCRWSSRDIGLSDQTAATGGWPKRENIHANRVQDIIGMYKGLQEKEKLEKEFFKKKQKEKIITYTDKTGLTAAALRKKIGLADPDKPFLRPKNAVKLVAPSKADENVDDFIEDVLTKPLNLLEITTIDQRLLQPDFQPAEMNTIFPIQKMLSIKRSLRCRNCEHNVSKPEYNPNSIKFKIQLFAFYHVPEIRIVTVQPLRAGQPSELILKFTNPTQHQTVVSFLPFNAPADAEPERGGGEGNSSEEATPKKQKPGSSLVDTSLTPRSHTNTVVPRPLNVPLNSIIEIPSSTFILPPRDDAAEYDDYNEAHNIQDDKKLVVWRKSNKAFIKLMVTPNEDVPINTPIVAGFTMSHLYTNTTASVAENKKPQKFDHNIKIHLDLGRSVGSN